jgi:hypothetical protein
VNAVAPYELATLGLDRQHFVRSDHKSWRGPCPRCGGHRRFVIWTDKPFPKWNWECSQCSAKGFADQLNTALRQEVSAEQRAEWARRNNAEREAREARRREKLAEFTTGEILAELAERMGAEHRAWWERQGVPEEWQRHLRIGYEPDKVYRGEDGELHHTPAYTLPFYHTGFEFVTLQYRLFEPPTPTDRYRFETGLGTSYYQTEPTHPIGERVIICEGAKKAIVTCVQTPASYTVLAVPSKADFGGVAEAVKDCERVYVLLDPDAGYRAVKLAKDIGLRARVAELPVKVDDGFLHYGLTADLLEKALYVARPA